MKSLIIGYIASSLESGIIKKIVISALRVLVNKSSNTVDDRLVDLLDSSLNNKKVNSVISEAMAKMEEKR